MDSTEQLLTLASVAVQANVPTILWGEPGIAKSALIAGIFDSLRWPYEIILGSIRDPTDFVGWPTNTEHGVVMSPHAWVMRLTEKNLGVDRNGHPNRAGLFLEEFNLAPKSVQAAMMRLVHEGVVGEEKLGKGVARIAAANPPESSAGGWALDPPLANRFFHINWSLSASFWAEGMVSGFQRPAVARIPEDWEKHIPQARVDISSYIYSKQDALHQRPEDASKASRAWPSPRTWDMASRLLAASYALGLNDGMKLSLVAGCVGDAAGQEYMEYRRKLDLPDPEKVLAHPEKVKWPNRGDKIFAILNSVVACIAAKNDEQRWLQGWKVLAMASKETMDVAAIAAKTLAKLRQKGYGTPTDAQEFYEAMTMANIIKTKAA